MRQPLQVKRPVLAKRIVQASLISLLLAGAACAGSGQRRSSGDDPDVISQEEIQQAGSTSSTYSLLQSLRPHWLRRRGRSSIENPGSVVVYVDGTRYGTPTSLHGIQVTNVESIEFLSASEATTRYGTGHDHGVILVEMKGGA